MVVDRTVGHNHFEQKLDDNWLERIELILIGPQEKVLHDFMQ